jgi:hypothetical protein
MTEENTLESVVADVVGKMKASVEVFDSKAREFEESVESVDEKASARRYTDSCRAVVTGTLDFTWVSYFLHLMPSLTHEGDVLYTVLIKKTLSTGSSLPGTNLSTCSLRMHR